MNPACWRCKWEEEEKRSLLLMETAEQTRQMRHDLRHHLTAIQAMAGDENPNLTAYLSELIRGHPRRRPGLLRKPHRQ